MLDNLTQRLAKVVKTMRGEARLTEANTADMLREVRLARRLQQRCRPGPRQRAFVQRDGEPVGFEFVEGGSISGSRTGEAERQDGGKQGEAHEHGSVGRSGPISE